MSEDGDEVPVEVDGLVESKQNGLINPGWSRAGEREGQGRRRGRGGGGGILWYTATV